MPFGLKNVSATYQILVNKMFDKKKLGKNIEVKRDEVVVMSKKAIKRLQDLEKAFNILDLFNMKLNPSK